ncbi:hypothetical protein [Psychrobacter sanguinis]|nr:hypothetical protein [Psychrobacter sanguinis]
MAYVLVEESKLQEFEEICQQALKVDDIKLGSSYIADYEQSGESKEED